MTLIGKITITFGLIWSFSAHADSFWQPWSTPKKDPVQELIDHPYSRYYSPEDIEQAMSEVSDGRILHGQMILVDTRVPESCKAVRDVLVAHQDMNALSDARDLCQQDPEFPIASVLIFREVKAEEWRRNIAYRNLTSHQKDLVSNTRGIALSAGQSDGIIYVLPTSVTSWIPERLQRQNRSSHFAIQRHTRTSPLKNFGQPVMMANFYWELKDRNPNKAINYVEIFKSPALGRFFTEIFNIVQGRTQNNAQAGSQRTNADLSMIVLSPEPSVANALSSIFNMQLSERSHLRLVTRWPEGKNNKDDGKNSSVNEDLPTRQAALNFLNTMIPLADMYWGLELEFRF
ncbi:MAG: hypothetical protein J7501_04220 [Bdellovibrio sp.]|nr:hypothetical protein [Bdellovibrio sp.]